MDDLLSDFLAETTENLSRLDLEMLRLEQAPDDRGLIGSIFRIVHTIKGTCGFLGLPRLEAAAHAAENVLGRFRDGALPVTPAAVTLVLEAIDAIKAIVVTLASTEAEPEGDDADLIRRLNVLAEGGAAVSASEPVPEQGRAAPEQAAAAPRAAHDAAPEAEALAAAPGAPAAPKPAAAKEGPAKAAGAREDKEGPQTIRVSVHLLETLMATVSELVLTRNQLMQILRQQKESAFAGPLQRLNHVTSELQEGVMKTRMQPIGNAWATLPRLIRDLANDLGKRIELEMLGADTELDRQVLELIKDPLTHMIRNAADHGIEPPAARAAAGKPETGRVRLNAYHEGGHILIEIADDGRGLPVSKIRAKALAQGLAGEAELDGMTDQQVQQFIFKPGFSTAAQVTAVSGRGVGMDVVKTNIERIGGTIEFASAEGRGSTFLIKIPLTLAIVSALIVECAGERFAVPQISVVELVRAGGPAGHAVERIRGAPVLRLRDRLLPLVSLRGLLRLGGGGDDRGEGQGEGQGADQLIIVTQAGARSFGILVDRVFDTEEIVVKPVSPVIRHINLFSGNTILGDGSVIMILDPNGIAAASGESAPAAAEAAADPAAARRATSDEQVALLVFRAGPGAPKAVPLALVARLEDVPEDEIEESDGRMVVQYRGRLMPLVPYDPGFALGRRARTPVLVFADRDRTMGLVVDEIIDIVEQPLKIQLSAARPGIMGSAVIAGRATDVIDAGHYLTQAHADWFDAGREAFTQARRERVLLVDDSPFFRNMLTPLLSTAGYDVTAASSADEALALHDAGAEFDVIVSDIEMPGMNGFELASAVRRTARWGGLPVLALSSHATSRDQTRGREAGFTGYVAKLDRDALLGALSQSLSSLKGAA